MRSNNVVELSLNELRSKAIFAARIHDIDRCAQLTKSYIQLMSEFQQIITDAYDVTLQKITPFYCGALFRWLENSSVSGLNDVTLHLTDAQKRDIQEKLLEYRRMANACEVIACRQAAISAVQSLYIPALQFFVQRLIACSKELALQDAENTDHPDLYRAEIFNWLAHSAKYVTEPVDLQNKIHWYRTAARLYISGGNKTRHVRCVECLIGLNREQAERDAFEFRYSDPLYAGEIFNLLYRHRAESTDASISEWCRWGGYCFTLANEKDRASYLIYRFVRKNESQAIEDAYNPFLQEQTPWYCAEIFFVLTRHEPGREIQIPRETLLDWYRCAVYYFAHTDDDACTQKCAIRFVRFDSSLVQQEWQRLQANHSPVIQKYSDALYEALIQHYASACPNNNGFFSAAPPPPRSNTEELPENPQLRQTK